MNKKVFYNSDEVEEYLKSHKITVLKTVKRQKSKKKKYNGSLLPCPECNSTLLVDKLGVIYCSQDKLKDIYKKCLEYDSANDKDKVEILKNDSGQLLEFYARWKKKDSSGNRSYFSCTYTNKLYTFLPQYNVLMSDPMQVKRLEKKLKRKLFENELNGTVKVVYYDKIGKVYEEQILVYRFPYDL